MTLIELMLTVAVMVLVGGVVASSMGGLLGLEQRDAARRLALTYERLHDEAVLRNVTFRVAFDLDANTWAVEVGDASAMIFSTPEAREAWEEAQAEREAEMSDQQLKLASDRQASAALRGAAQQDVQRAQATFTQVKGDLAKKMTLPGDTRFKSVFTPQYEEPVTPSRDGGRRRGNDDGEGSSAKAYSYIFADGTSERTLIQIIEGEDDDEGLTIVVDPLTGRAKIHFELMDQHDLFGFIPDEGPRLDL